MAGRNQTQAAARAAGSSGRGSQLTEGGLWASSIVNSIQKRLVGKLRMEIDDRG
jgi:hypothetical protein